MTQDEWDTLDESGAELKGLMRRHIDLPGLSWVRFQPTPVHGRGLEPFESAHDLFGDGSLVLLPTPGHTPGSQCFFVDAKLVSGDTLFLDGCGRTDLPGGDPEELYFSLTQRLAKVPDTAVLYPGHQYSAAPSASVGDTREHNFVFRPKTPEQWMMMFGGA